MPAMPIQQCPAIARRESDEEEVVLNDIIVALSL